MAITKVDSKVRSLDSSTCAGGILGKNSPADVAVLLEHLGKFRFRYVELGLRLPPADGRLWISLRHVVVPWFQIVAISQIGWFLRYFGVITRRNRRGDCRSGGFAFEGVAYWSAVICRAVCRLLLLDIPSVWIC